MPCRELAAVDMLQPCPPAEILQCSEHTGRDVNGPRAERGCYVVSSDRRFGSNVERSRGASIDHPRDRLGDVIGVNKRNAQAPDQAAEAVATEPNCIGPLR
jgi:hypothetical protein